MQTHDKIRTLREAKKITQEEFAEKLSMSASGYSKIERGETQLNLNRLQQIADILAISVFDLLPSSGGIIQTLNGAYHFNGTFNQYSDAQQEIEKLQLTISHLNQLLEQKQQQIDMQ
ncbi:helix-turn-helix domain-containing protein [Moraxella cuniculi]|uniref:Predicted transcriptional regulator n=1 Tax=Moraxella cuniculi TaxID=34061 RepID=A0A3S4UUT7_9GAMM|nr:helix-turn-helix transcriptional regulator [Moraxella cuniculi]VEG13505.1 Predicted transcriptional regulator [Moraxella cuniculi]